MWGEKTYFTELYGNYQIKQNEGFIFAQQYKYDQDIYNEESKIIGRVFRDNKVIAEHTFDVNFATGEVSSVEEAEKKQTKRKRAENELTVAVVFEYDKNVTITEYAETVENDTSKKEGSNNLITMAAVNDRINDPKQGIFNIRLLALLLFLIFYIIAISLVSAPGRSLEERVQWPPQNLQKTQKPVQKQAMIKSVKRELPQFLTEELRKRLKDLPKIQRVLPQSISGPSGVLHHAWKKIKTKVLEPKRAKERTRREELFLSQKRVEDALAGGPELGRIEAELQQLGTELQLREKRKKLFLKPGIEEKWYKSLKEGTGKEDERKASIGNRYRIVTEIPTTRGVEWASPSEERKKQKELSHLNRIINSWTEPFFGKRRLKEEFKRREEEKARQEVRRISEKISEGKRVPLSELQRIDDQLRTIKIEPVLPERKKNTIPSAAHDFEKQALEKELREIASEITGYRKPIQILPEPIKDQKLLSRLEMIETKLPGSATIEEVKKSEILKSPNLTEEKLEKHLKAIRTRVFHQNKSKNRRKLLVNEKIYDEDLQKINGQIRSLGKDRVEKYHLIPDVPATGGISWTTEEEKRRRQKELSHFVKILSWTGSSKTDEKKRRQKEEKRKWEEKAQEDVRRIVERLSQGKKEPRSELQCISEELKQLENNTPEGRERKRIIPYLKERTIREEVLENEMREVSREIAGYRSPIQILPEPVKDKKLQLSLEKVENKLRQIEQDLRISTKVNRKKRTF